MSIVKKARLYAMKQHDGQFRRDGKTPYFNHLEEVARLVEHRIRMRGGDNLIAAAYLHDCVEDGNTTIDDIAEKFNYEITEIVSILTHRGNETYNDYIDRVLMNIDASRIKVADILANLSDAPTEKQVKKYSMALKKLLDYEQ